MSSPLNSKDNALMMSSEENEKYINKVQSRLNFPSEVSMTLV